MATQASAALVEEGRLRLSRAPHAELSAAALEAQEAAGLDSADFIVIAVTPGEGGDALEAAEAAAKS